MSEPSRPPQPPGGHGGGPRSVAERFLDLFVYLPAGVLLTALEDTSGAVAKGRARVDQELRNAQLVGRFAVDLGWRQLRGQVEALAREGREALEGREGHENRAASENREARQARETPAAASPKEPPRRGERAAGTRSPGGRPGPVTSAHRPASGRTEPHRAEAHRPEAHRAEAHRAEPHRGPSRPRAELRGEAPPRDADVDHVIPDYDILAASQVVRRLDGLDRDELSAVLRHERATRARRAIIQRAEELLGELPGSERGGPTGTGGAL